MPAVFTPAPELAKRAENIIRDHHDHLYGDQDFIIWLWRDTAQNRKGKSILGKSSLLKGKAALPFFMNPSTHEIDSSTEITDQLFVIEIAEDKWAILSSEQRTALIDQMLSHCRITLDNAGEAKYEIVEHDIKEFKDIRDRHGDWLNSQDTIAGTLDV